VKEPFYGGYGLIAERGIPKPAFGAFRLLHKLGDERLTVDSDSALVTRRKDGAIVLSLWNLVPLGQSGAPKTVILEFQHLGEGRRAYISRLDRDHGDPHPAYGKMGSPRYPTRAQIKELRSATELPPPESRDLMNGRLTLTIPPEGLALIELK
jgi:xylan 1,4-beta-xylosidase